MSRRILLADDSLTIQKVVELTFADTDFEVIAVSSGDDLLAKLPECNPDLVICDVIMPGRDGYEVCQEIKSNPDFLHVPVVLLTGTFEPFDHDRALAVGSSEIITKPFEAKRLVEAVEKLTSEPGTAAPAVQGTEKSEPFDDGRVNPPPPIETQDTLNEVEASYDLEDTAVTAEAEALEPATEADTDGLEFTKSGFSAMEAAGREQEDHIPEPPADGLDFEIGGEDESKPAAGFSADPISPAGETAETTEEVSDIPPSDPFGDTPEPTEEVQPVTPPEPFSAADEPVFDEPPVEETADPVFDEAPVQEPSEPVFDEPYAPEAEEPVFDEPTESTGDAVFEEPILASDHDRSKTTPINVAEVMQSTDSAAPLRGESFVATPPAPEEESRAADTQDFAAPEQPTPEAPESTPGPSQLTDDEIDRIARRVLELAGDRIDHVAWEVLPDMAEIVVRERLREIEAEAESNGP